MSRLRAPRPLILDAGALIALEGRERRLDTLIGREREVNGPILIPVGALAQVWRDGSRQARLARLLNSDDVQKKSDAELTDFIANGGPSKKASHSFSQKGLSAEQIKALVAQVRSLKK